MLGYRNNMENRNLNRPLKQPKTNLDEDTINPILRKLINNMNREGFMIEETNTLKRLEEYKKKLNK